MHNAAARREAGRDRLSELPDEILLDILERADTLDALRTCVLSKRLLRLPAMFSRFDINITSLTQHHDKVSHGSLTISHLARYNNALAAVTEKILRTRSLDTPIIYVLRVRCYLMPDECLPITRAFASTMATHKVDHAEFVPLVEKPFRKATHEDRVCYAKRFNTCLGDCPAAFAGLTRMWLYNMRFGELDIPNILNTCNRLEHLRLTRCDAGVRSVLLVEHDRLQWRSQTSHGAGAKAIRCHGSQLLPQQIIQISTTFKLVSKETCRTSPGSCPGSPGGGSASDRLVELIVDGGQLEAVHLNHVPKLQRLTCAGWSYPVPLAFGYVPQLSTLSLVEKGISSTTNLQLSLLLANVYSIRDLCLDFRSEKIWVVPEGPKLLGPMLGKLETLTLDNLPEGCDIAWTMYILEAAPFLRDLCITLWDHWCNMVIDQDARKEHKYREKENVKWQPSASGLKHKNLVKLTIHGFQPDENLVRYVRRIMEFAVNMGEISLHDRKAWECCGELDPKVRVCASSYPRTDEEKDMWRTEITKGLPMAALPNVIHFRS